MTAINAGAPYSEARRARASFVAACFAVLVAQGCLTALAPVNGLIQTEMGATGTQLTWLTALVFAPTAFLELNFGVLGDLFGRKRLVVLGTALCTAGALINTFAANVPVLYVGEVVMGV